jgi:hypothetical protein
MGKESNYKFGLVKPHNIYIAETPAGPKYLHPEYQKMN